MRPPASPQSALRRPLNRVLAGEGHVRVLRELLRHGGELGAADVATRVGLSPQHVRSVLAHLVRLGLVDRLGPGRAHLYRARLAHPLAESLAALFAAEEARFAALLAAVRAAAAAARPRPLAVWLYGSVARGDDAPESDVDVAVVAAAGELNGILSDLRERLRDTAEALGVELALVGATPADVARAAAGDTWWRGVVRDAVPIFGPDPTTLLARSRAAGPDGAAA
jgi:predicted nucleotidyltransferase